MRPDLLRKFEAQRVPRYTSYPTSPHFTHPIDDDAYRRWLSTVPEDASLSVYLHVPFCRTLCWYCGCHTKIVAHDAPITAYLDALEREIDLVAAALPRRMAVGHLHWGGGTPTIMAPEAFLRLMTHLRERFAFSAATEIAVEIDPRRIARPMIDGLAAAGVTRASLGVQTFDPVVQKAINRIQSFEQTARATEALRAAGVAGVNFDLIYGLPHQTTESCKETVEQALRLAPDRFAVFGYAHLPALKAHQRLIDEAALPGAAARFAQFQTIADRLTAAGYRRIGLDHFARPGDDLARCQDTGRLHRNFQGYTSDPSSILVGFGASAIGTLPEGYVQNATAIREYRNALAENRLPVRRSRSLTPEDRLRGDIIERIMCDFGVDIGAMIARHGITDVCFDTEFAQLRDLERDGIVRLDGLTVRVEEPFWPLVRSVAAVFDAYLQPEANRHAAAV